MGEVWRAKHRLLSRQAAVKLIRTDALSSDSGAAVETVLRRFEREAQATSTLQSPHTVEVYDFGITEEGTFYYAMELLEGLDLQTLVERWGPLPSERVVAILAQVCDSLAEAHHNGLIHRDLKPANIFLTQRGLKHDFVKVLDFGLVKSANRPVEENPNLTKTGAIVGSPAYISPEAIRGSEIDERVDLYALGCVAYWLMTGRLVFEADTIPEMLVDHLGKVPEPPSNITELEIPPELERLVLACLEKEPEDRPSSIQALIPQLEACPVGRPWTQERAKRWWRIHRPIDPDASDEVRVHDVMQESPALQLLEEARAKTETQNPPPSSLFDWSDFRLGRIAQWSHKRYRLDSEFVQLTLLVDQGEESESGRWSPQTERYTDLGNLLEAIPDRALVILGPPGCGKSTLLRRLELDVAKRGLRGETDQLTFFIQLNQYRGAAPGEQPLAPGVWLRERWAARHPGAPSFDDVLAEGRVLLLLDALNEMPTTTPADLRNAVLGWKAFLDRLMTDHPGNRVVFSCRTLDYSAPLSTSNLRVPQVVVEPFTDEQVEQFLLKHNPDQGTSIWSDLSSTPQLELMRSPYFLSLLSKQVQENGDIPNGRAGLFTGFVRQSLRREIERDNPLFAPDELLTARDVRRITQWKWKANWELPERGPLVPKLVNLAYDMQDQSGIGGAAQVSIDLDDALDLLSHERDEDIVRAGLALSVLDEDTAQDELLFAHQLTQEYFAARRLAADPQPERVSTPWKTADVQPPIRDAIASVAPGDALSALPTTGWEETALLAGAMSDDPDGFVRDLMETQLELAGRCAGQPDVRQRLSGELIDHLRTALLARSRDSEADLRARIAAGLALGALGDPRLELRTGPEGEYLLPPMVEIEGGSYPIGEDEPFEFVGKVVASHIPRHEVQIEPFKLGRFLVTNAEWAFFMKAGGYEDPRWWTTPSAKRWWSGEGTADGDRANFRHWCAYFRQAPKLLDEIWESGPMTEEEYELMKTRIAMTEAELEEHLLELCPGGKMREPAHWHDERYNNPAMPVVGVSWFEVLAYANWLSAQTGSQYRLPSEVEWEAAARGHEGRVYAWGNEFDLLRGNSRETRIQRATPVGVFVEGDTPEGACDLTGNVGEWTSSLFGPGMDDTPAFSYPYRSSDGREDLSVGSDIRRVLRGGGSCSDALLSRSIYRGYAHPDDRNFAACGVRLVQE